MARLDDLVYTHGVNNKHLQGRLFGSRQVLALILLQAAPPFLTACSDEGTIGSNQTITEDNSSGNDSSGNDSSGEDTGTDTTGGTSAGNGSGGSGSSGDSGGSNSGPSSVSNTSSGGGNGDDTTSDSTSGGGMQATNTVSTTGEPIPFVPPQCADTPDLPSTAPQLSTETWTNISPPNVPFDANASAITQGMTIDPCNPNTIYVCIGDGESGIYRSIDGGGTWSELGDFKFPVRVRVDPRDPLHLYVGAGVRGGGHGFWVSEDGGANWAIPAGFSQTIDNNGGNYDVYHVEPDPADFNHVLVTFHGAWSVGDAGIYESFDGGDNWTIHPPFDGAFSGGDNIFFLYRPSEDPDKTIGDSQTWLFGTQGSGYFRTSDGGQNWDHVLPDISMTHGGGSIYYTDDGVLYITSNSGILRSEDNGESFTTVVPSNSYIGLIGDGTRLWTGQHFSSRFLIAREDDDTNWSEFSSQQFDEGPFEMAIDRERGILYSANIRAGVWALKLPD